MLKYFQAFSEQINNTEASFSSSDKLHTSSIKSNSRSQKTMKLRQAAWVCNRRRRMNVDAFAVVPSIVIVTDSRGVLQISHQGEKTVTALKQAKVLEDSNLVLPLGCNTCTHLHTETRLYSESAIRVRKLHRYLRREIYSYLESGCTADEVDFLGSHFRWSKLPLCSSCPRGCRRRSIQDRSKSDAFYSICTLYVYLR